MLGIGLVLGLALAMVLGLAHFTFCHTSIMQKPASLQARILPITSSESVVLEHKDIIMEIHNIHTTAQAPRNRINGICKITFTQTLSAC